MSVSHSWHYTVTWEYGHGHNNWYELAEAKSIHSLKDSIFTVSGQVKWYSADLHSTEINSSKRHIYTIVTTKKSNHPEDWHSKWENTQCQIWCEWAQINQKRTTTVQNLKVIPQSPRNLHCQGFEAGQMAQGWFWCMCFLCHTVTLFHGRKKMCSQKTDPRPLNRG